MTDAPLTTVTVPAAVTTDDYDAVVYDLDGTLVDLDVDWGAVREDVAAALRAEGLDVAGADVWDMLERSVETGHRDVVESVLARHERDGAETAERLALADELPGDRPVGVVSLNCEAACRDALAEHGLADRVDVVVGRDTVETFKPDPAPLLAAVERLGVEPERTLFVGDSASDETTAARAGTDFQRVRDRVQER